MRHLKYAVVAALALAVPAWAQTSTTLVPPSLGPAPPVSSPLASVIAPASAASPGTTATGGTHHLTAEDVSAYLDGFMPYALQRGNVAGAVVVVVKDGQILFQRGYGFSNVKKQSPVNPDTTLFRVGSISKLFTWTAVMQLVQAGKINLDQDINSYLDFKIPPAFGKPITMREVMTHSEGFSDVDKDLFFADPKLLRSLRTALVTNIPARIFPPGTTAAYSNYGASLAGYIVQRLSGEPFDAYVARHIFAPLGMTHSTFDQPLPKGWSANMSDAYEDASGPPHPFEFISLAPCGALSTSGGDMARFMIAQLQNGVLDDARILDDKTIALMHSPQFRPVPPLPAMDLGFYQEPGNGHRIIGHAGDTEFFHSDLHLYLDDHVGLFISLNSASADAAAHSIRPALFRGFTDRYFPAPKAAAKPTWAHAVQDGRTLSGLYVSSRRSDSGWLRIASYLLGQASITSDKDGTLVVSSFRGVNDQLKHWREVAPFVYHQINGQSRLAAVVRDGKAISVTSDDLPPVFVLQPVSGWMSASWNKPLFFATLAILALAVLLWPIVAIVRWRYRQGPAFPRQLSMLYRLTRITVLLDLVFLVAWLVVLQVFSSNLELFTSKDDWILRLVQLTGVLGVVGVVAPLAYMIRAFAVPQAGWWTKLNSVAIATSCVATIWFAFSLHLLTFSLNY